MEDTFKAFASIAALIAYTYIPNKPAERYCAGMIVGTVIGFCAWWHLK